MKDIHKLWLVTSVAVYSGHRLLATFSLADFSWGGSTLLLDLALLTSFY
jgi:hypothetical protein